MLDHTRASRSAQTILARDDDDRELLALCSTMSQVASDMSHAIEAGRWEAAAYHAAEVEQLARVVGCFSQLKAPPYGRWVCQACDAESVDPGACSVCEGPTRDRPVVVAASA